MKKHFYGGGNMFKLHSEYKPTGDQPQAIEYLSKGIKTNIGFGTQQNFSRTTVFRI